MHIPRSVSKLKYLYFKPGKGKVVFGFIKSIKLGLVCVRILRSIGRNHKVVDIFHTSLHKYNFYQNYNT
jgi:hypothetical protein